ncbi:hypothetical protein ACXHMN_06095 [Rhizobium sp. LEGMi12c]
MKFTVFTRHIPSAGQIFFARRNYASETRSEAARKNKLPVLIDQSRKRPEFQGMGRIGLISAAAQAATRQNVALNDDAANNGRNEQECSRKQDDMNRRLNLLPRLGGALGTIELIHMRIRHTQIRHVLPPFVSYMFSGPSPERTFIHFLSIR